MNNLFKIGSVFFLLFSFVIYVGYIWQKNQSAIANHYILVHSLSKLKFHNKELSFILTDRFYTDDNRINHIRNVIKEERNKFFQNVNFLDNEHSIVRIQELYEKESQVIHKITDDLIILKESTRALKHLLSDKKITNSLSPEKLKYAYELSYHSFTQPLLIQKTSVSSGKSALTKYEAVISRYLTKIHTLLKLRDDLKIETELNNFLEDVLRDINIYEKKDSYLTLFFTLSSLVFIMVGFITFLKERKAHYEGLEITQEKEQFIKALNEANIISKADLDGKITFINDKFCKISGYSEAELIGQPHNIVRSPDMDPEFFKDLWSTIKSKKTFKGIITNHTKNGEEYIVDTVIMPVVNKKGDLVEYLAIRHDITELVQSREKAKAAEKAKDEFLSNMSHELRTPLNGILGFTKLLMAKSTNTEHEYCQTIYNSASQLLQLINDILDISKIQSGKFLISPHPFHLKQNLITFIPRFLAQIAQGEITLIPAFEDDTDVYLNGDWLRISQIITNLISNAIKFTPPKGKIYLHVAYENQALFIQVKDNGIGMSGEVQSRIFTPFEQADGSTTRKYGGTGLGLSITSKLIEMMHGTLKLTSAEGEGTTFDVHLPLKTTQMNLSKKDKDKKINKLPLKGHLLVAEDNSTNQMLIRIILEELGLSCDIAKDGIEAIELYETHDYDLVLMDENMPNMNGVDAMLRLREIYGTNLVPIIALTANVMEGDKEHFLHAGMDDFLGKPINEEELYLVLARFLERQ